MLIQFHERKNKFSKFVMTNSKYCFLIVSNIYCLCYIKMKFHMCLFNKLRWIRNCINLEIKNNFIFFNPFKVKQWLRYKKKVMIELKIVHYCQVLWLHFWYLKNQRQSERILRYIEIVSEWMLLNAIWTIFQFSAISWREQYTFDEMITLLDFYTASSLKQQLTYRLSLHSDILSRFHAKFYCSFSLMMRA